MVALGLVALGLVSVACHALLAGEGAEPVSDRRHEVLRHLAIHWVTTSRYGRMTLATRQIRAYRSSSSSEPRRWRQ
ncbi:MAG: hypothetical protein IT305_25285 [Chloroflexi bacterium]|nr:hypothetical protein [Chloroflexota bacterium]